MGHTFMDTDGLVKVRNAVDNAQGAATVTPNDSVDLPKNPTKFLYVGGAGDVKVTLASGVVVTFKALSIGIFHPISVTRIWATGTTATSIVALY